MRKKAMRNVSIMTELSTEKVELGIVDDFEKMYDSALNKYRKVVNQTLKNLNNAGQDLEQIEREFVVALKKGEQAEESAKDLGIKLPNKVSNNIQGIKTMVKSDIQPTIRKIANLISTI